MSEHVVLKRRIPIPGQLSESHQERTENFFLELSPYDMPRFVSCQYDPEQKSITIDFEYIDHEQAVGSPTKNQIATFVGKHTGKLIRLVAPMEYPASADALAALRNDLGAAIMSSLPHRIAGRMNRKVSLEIIDNAFDAGLMSPKGM